MTLRSPRLLYLCSAVIGGVFILSGTSQFVHGTSDSTLLASILPSLIAQRAFSILEIAVGAGLLIPMRSHLPRVVGLFLLCTFTGVLLAEARKANPKPCGCGGSTAPSRTMRSASDVRFDLAVQAGQNTLFILGLVSGMIGTTPRTRGSRAVELEAVHLTRGTV